MIFAVFVPLLFLAVFLAAAVRRVKVYDSFASGAAGVLPLLKALFPYIAAVLVLAELFEESGLSSLLAEALSPAFGALGIPKEIARLVLIKPFSGSGALSVVSELFSEYGADSYIGRCASSMPRGRRCSTSPPSILRAAGRKNPSCPSSSRLSPILLRSCSGASSAAFCENVSFKLITKYTQILCQKSTRLSMFPA